MSDAPRCHTPFPVILSARTQWLCPQHATTPPGHARCPCLNSPPPPLSTSPPLRSARLLLPQQTQDLIDAAAKEDYEARLRRHEQIKIREAAEADRQAEELRRQAEVDEARRRRDELARAAQDKWVGWGLWWWRWCVCVHV